MDHKKIRAIGAGVLAALWIVLTGFAWFGQRTEVSEAERRPLASAPALSLEAINEGEFMEKFEDFTLDQFPLRDSFRQLKALYSKYLLRQQDNNGIYVADGYIAEMQETVNKVEETVKDWDSPGFSTSMVELGSSKEGLWTLW